MKTVATTRLLAYATPAIPLAFLGLPLYVYLPAHYASLPALGLTEVGMMLLLARLLDLITDPLVGLLADRTRPWLQPQWLISLGAMLLLTGAWWLFRPASDAGAIYLLLTLSVTYLGWTLMAIPYYGLGAELAGVEGNHTAVAAWREAGVIVGTLTALLLPALLTQYPPLELSAITLFWLLPPSLLAIWWLRPASLRYRNNTNGGLRAMWQHTSPISRQLLGIHFLNVTAGGTAATLFVLYTRDVLGVSEGISGLLLLIYFVAGLLALPLWTAYARRFGQVRTWRLAMLAAALGFLPAAFLGAGDSYGFVAVCLFTGMTLGADIAMPAALQSRQVVAESRAIEQPRGGALFGLWGMAGKLGLALSAGIALPLLALLSSPTTGWEQNEVLPWLYAGLPSLIKLLAVFTLQHSQLMRPEAFNLVRATERNDENPKSLAAGGVDALTGRVQHDEA